jgi:DNA repair ATPase RecN
MTQSRFNAFPLSLSKVRHRGVATLAIVGFALAVAGCGGGGGGQLSKSQYEDHLQTDSKAITKAFKPLSTPPSSLSQLASELKTGQDELRSASDDLSGVKPPKDVAKDNQALAKGLQTLADELDALRKAAAKKDPTQVQKALNELKTSHALVNARNATDDMRKKGYKLGGFG